MKKSLKVPKGGRQEEYDDLHLNLRLRCSKEISKRKRAELKTNQTIDNNYIQPDGEFVSSEEKTVDLFPLWTNDFDAGSRCPSGH